MNKKTLLFVMTIGAMLYSTSLWASSNGLINSVSYQSIPTSATISVQMLDNSDQNIALAKEMSRALRNNGYTLEDNATLVLTIETRDEIGGWTSIDRRHVMELSTQQTDSNDDNTQVKFNLFNSNTGGILNKGENSGTRIVTPSRYLVSITVEDASNGKRLWEGWASTDIGAASDNMIRRSIAPALVNAIGSTINNQLFDIK